MKATAVKLTEWSYAELATKAREHLAAYETRQAIIESYEQQVKERFDGRDYEIDEFLRKDDRYRILCGKRKWHEENARTYAMMATAAR